MVANFTSGDFYGNSAVDLELCDAYASLIDLERPIYPILFYVLGRIVAVISEIKSSGLNCFVIGYNEKEVEKFITKPKEEIVEAAQNSAVKFVEKIERVSVKAREWMQKIRPSVIGLKPITLRLIRLNRNIENDIPLIVPVKFSRIIGEFSVKGSFSDEMIKLRRVLHRLLDLIRSDDLNPGGLIFCPNKVVNEIRTSYMEIRDYIFAPFLSAGLYAGSGGLTDTRKLRSVIDEDLSGLNFSKNNILTRELRILIYILDILLMDEIGNTKVGLPREMKHRVKRSWFVLNKYTAGGLIGTGFLLLLVLLRKLWS